MFTHLHLENWRNFTRVEVSLGRRVLLAGPNASGKSNLLDVFRFLREVASPGGGFEQAVGKRGGISRLRCLAARQPSHVSIAVGLRSEEGTDWEYELSFQETLVGERVTRDGNDLLLRPDETDRADPGRLSQTALEQVSANREFRELAALLAGVRDAPAAHDPLGAALIAEVAAAADNTQRTRLRAIEEALRVVVPQLDGLELWRDGHGAAHLRARYSHWRPQGAWQTEEQFSDGTLRLIALLWAAQETTGTLLLEEPERSLHAEVVRKMLGMLDRPERQLMASTHAEDLLRGAGLEVGEVLLLAPSEEGTAVRAAVSVQDVAALLAGDRGGAGGEGPNIDQLELFCAG